MLLLGAGIATWVAYIQFQGLEPSSFPISISLVRSSGTLAPGRSVEPQQLESLGFAVSTTAAPEYREYAVRPVNYWEKGLSAAPRDLLSGARVVVHEGHWSLTARKGLGVWLFFAVLAGGCVAWSRGSLASLLWAGVVIITSFGDWWSSRATYLRLEGQLRSLNQGGV